MELENYRFVTSSRIIHLGKIGNWCWNHRAKRLFWLSHGFKDYYGLLINFKGTFTIEGCGRHKGIYQEFKLSLTSWDKLTLCASWFDAVWSTQYLPCNILFLYKFIYFIYLFLAVLGLRCCARAFSSCGEQGLLFVVVHGLLIVVASLVAEHGL